MSQSNATNPKFRFLVAMLEETDREFMAYYGRCMKTKLSRPCWDKMLAIMYRDLLQAKLNLVEEFPAETWSEQEAKRIRPVGHKAVEAARDLWPHIGR
jgi:hypothetical protein